MANYKSTPHDTKRMPPGIPFIIGNEVAERFSFYGMNAILTVFMTQHLLNAAGEPDFMGDEQAKGVFHLFKAAAYFFPILGAILSDVLWGKYKTILLISLMYCLGHGMLALMDVGPATGSWDMRPFMYAGLLLIAVGAGGIKPCVSAHVGDQFGPKNKHLLTQVFNWFYFSINVGAATSTMLTPFLLAKFGPALAFGVPGALMAVATFVFWMGRNRFVHVPPSGWQSFKEETFSPAGKRAIKNLAPLFLIFVPVFWSIFDQTASAWVLQARAMDREFAGVLWLESQIQVANPILILTLIPIFTYVIYPFVGRFVKVTPLRKIGAGLFLTAVAFGFSAVIEENISGGLVTDTSMEAGDGAYFESSYLIDGEADGKGYVSEPVLWSDEDAERPEIQIRLRERSAWTIDSVTINPAAYVGEPLKVRAPVGDPPTFEEFVEDEDLSEKTADERRALYERHLAQRDLRQRTADRYEADLELIENVPDEQAKEIAERLDDAAMLTRVEILAHAPGATTTDDGKKAMAWTSMGVFDVAPENRPQTFSFEPTEADFVKLRLLGSNGDARVKVGEVRVLAAGTPSTLAQRDGVWPDVASTGFQPSIGWQFLAYILMTAAEILVSIVSLEFAYTQAPKKMKSFIMGVYFLGVSIGNLFTSGVNFVLGSIKEVDGSTPLDGATYYWAFTGLVIVTGIVFIFYSKTYKGDTYIQGEDDELAAAEAKAEAPEAR